MTFNRREFMKLAAASGALAGVSTMLGCATPGAVAGSKGRVVVVGGGFGGATAARYLRMWGGNVDVTLVEGACANEDHLEAARAIRERSRMVIAFGDCAVTGNVTAIRNALGSALPVLERAYLDAADLQPRLPDWPGVVPRLLDRVLPLHEVIAVDAWLPGCPPDADLIHAVLLDALAGRVPDLHGRLRYG